LFLISVKATAATSQSERAALESAGEVLLALNQHGAGAHLGLLLVLAAACRLFRLCSRGGAVKGETSWKQVSNSTTWLKILWRSNYEGSDRL
jgi:hypothetical protein